ncbi:hypothetical protein E1292_20345 [Nonomuraea deserti]|uniref:Lipoprotein n=1 Tax=Nonomuraea deserti TaxID=1848322 RepID=A0A4R4VU49_9ACTN|nr:hypothetical protein [Nonomuraea deserti]TDD03830.1 hypothetical protein E1292_20345 [Nonomuraea deserti]
MAKRHLATLAVIAGLVLPVAGCGSGAATTTAISMDRTGTQEAVVSADYPAFASVQEMWDDADLVVQANVTGMRTARDKPSKILEPGDEGYDDPRANPLYGLGPDELAEARKLAEQEVGDIVTIATADITHVFKGGPADVRSVEVRQLGGELGGEKLTALDEVKLGQDRSYLLFLHAWDDTGDHTMVSPEQGQYVATSPDGRAATSAKAGDTYTPLPGNPLQVTRAALDELAKTD